MDGGLYLCIMDSRQSEAAYCAQLKQQTKALFDATGPIKCPYFKSELVHFTSDGFHHFQYNTSGSERSKKAQIRRYKSFRFAPYILQRAGTLQEHRRYSGAIGRPKGDGFRIVKEIEDWCFSALLPAGPGKDVCIKVVVRRIGDGKLNFCSVMPHSTGKYLSQTGGGVD